MRILIIGAGVIGSCLAKNLSKVHEVTLLARSNYEGIKRRGVSFEKKGKVETFLFPCVSKLEPEDFYDLIFVTVRADQAGKLKDVLSVNASSAVCFTGNNMLSESLCDIPDKKVFFGFYAAGGKREDGLVKAVNMNKMTMGRTDGKDCDDAFLTSVFAGTAVKLTIENRMHDYLKSHACGIIPYVFACYKAEGDLRRLKHDRVYSYEVIDACVEGYEVLRACGYEILPDGEYEKCTKKRGLMALVTRIMFATPIGRIGISDHAMSAYEEFDCLYRDFLTLKDKSGLETKKLDLMYAEFQRKKVKQKYGF